MGIGRGRKITKYVKIQLSGEFMQQEQQNAFNRQCISEALIRLMETKAYDDITVTEICCMVFYISVIMNASLNV